MKTFKQIITVVALAIFSLLTGNAQENNKIAPNQYGEMHNQILENFYGSGKKVSDYSSNADLVDAVTKITLKLYPDIEKYPNFYEGINSIKSSFRYSKINKENVFNDLKDNLWRMKDSKKNVNLYNITSDFIKFRQFDKVKDVYPDLNPFEKELIERFNSILKHSKSYWTNKYKQTKREVPGNDVILADAVGGLIFWATGPGSLVAAAVYSMIINTYA